MGGYRIEQRDTIRFADAYDDAMNLAKKMHAERTLAQAVTRIYSCIGADHYTLLYELYNDTII